MNACLDRSSPIMADAISASSPGSALIQRLSAFCEIDAAVPFRGFVDRLGQLIGLPGSIILSKVHDALPEAAVSSPQTGFTPPGEIFDIFVQTHGQLVRMVVRQFDPDRSASSDRLPTAAELHSHFKMTGVFKAALPGSPKIHAAAYAPFGKFYTSCQWKLERNVRQLRARIGEAVSHTSPRLARLRSLDSGLDKVFGSHARDLFAIAPRLLEKQFGALFDAHRKERRNAPTISEIAKWMTEDGWIALFCNEMRTLLLDELDIRLQPVSGMIEAFANHINTSGYDEEGGK